MRREFLGSLHCPYSGSPFTLNACEVDDRGSIRWGVVTSESGEFPIVDGILRLQADEFCGAIVDEINARRFDRALRLALDEVPFHGRKGAIINLFCRIAFKSGRAKVGDAIARIKQSWSRKFRQEITFSAMANELCRGPAADWQVHRFSMPTFLSTYPLMQVVQGNGPILDFSCGTGQASFLISRYWQDTPLVCADYSFSSLYLARKYFAPNADFVCLDGDYPLPFASGYFATVFSSDALHCIDSKLGLAGEFVRVLAPAGVVVMPHLHNKLAPTRYARSLSPEGYAALFPTLNKRIVPEERLVKEYFGDRQLDLERSCLNGEARGAKLGLSIVMARDTAPFRVYPDGWNRWVDTMKHPIVNPAYVVRRDAGGWTLQRPANAFLEIGFGIEQSWMPRNVRLEVPDLSVDALLELRRADRGRFEDLVRKLVLIEAPSNFVVPPAS
jgi:SAM-dependent methyltransferase